MGSPEIKDLFYKSRFIGGWHLLGACVYFPVGLVLALVRVFMSLQAYLLALLLLIPELSLVRKYVLRAMSLVLGVLVIEENPSQRDKNVRVLVGNHISILDHIPIHLFTGCFSPSQWEVWPLCLKVFDNSADKHKFTASLRTHLTQSTQPLLLQPEETPTNGRVGLLKFSPWCATVAPSVQPVCLQLWRPLGITPSTLAASFSTDLFWFLFSPITVFRVRYLPVVQRQDGESDEEMADRVSLVISKELGLVNTKFTAKDKVEYEKRYMQECRQAHNSSAHAAQMTPRYSFELNRMATQVAEVLPYVPLDAILRDLGRTRSVDLTISNILEGAVRFTPVPPEQRVNPNTAAARSATASTSSEASSSGRSARMMSFVERKTKLIEEARKRYMEKHGLVDKQ